eukprot:tig00000157_g9717.t1
MAAESYDLFLSHKQSTGGDLAGRIKSELEVLRPGIRVFIDVDALGDIHDLAAVIRSTRCFVLIITPEWLESLFVLRELATAVRAQRRILIVWDRDRLPNFPQIDSRTVLPRIDEMGDAELRGTLQRVLMIKAIPYIREKAFRETALREILQRFDAAQPFRMDAAPAPAPAPAPINHGAAAVAADMARLSVSELSVRSGESVAAAVARAAPGQTIRVQPGRYKEQLVLDKAVHVVGPREAVLEWDQSPTLHCKGPVAPSVKGITIRNTGPKNGTLWITGGSQAVVEGCDVSSAGMNGIEVKDDGTAPTLRGNAVHDCGGAGIFFYTSAKGVAEGNDVYGNANSGIQISEGADPVVKGNKVHDGKAAGMYVLENGRGTVEGNDVYGNANSGIAIKTGADPVVRGNKVHDGKQGGILVYENGRGTVEGNDVYGNAKSGIQISIGADPVVRGNTVHDGKAGGILVNENGRGTVEGNDVYGNVQPGIGISTGADPVVKGNKVHDGKQGGIFVCENGRGTVEGNDVYGNAFSGIEIKTGADPVVRGNKVRDGKLEGIFVYENGRGTVEGNDVYGNALAGIQIREGADPVVRGNRVHDQKYGICVRDGGKGTISGNTLERISDPSYAPCSGVKVLDGCTPAVQGNTFRQ